MNNDNIDTGDDALARTSDNTRIDVPLPLTLPVQCTATSPETSPQNNVTLDVAISGTLDIANTQTLDHVSAQTINRTLELALGTDRPPCVDPIRNPEIPQSPRDDIVPTDAIKLKVEDMPIHRFEEIDVAEIASVIEQNHNFEHTYKYEDIEMTYDTLPRPLMATEQNIIKREEDEFSGNIPFNMKVN